MDVRRDKILGRKDVCDTAGISSVTLWRLERAGRFPKRRQLSARRVGWLESEVQAWLQSRLEVA